jgi:hypothetical protein
VSNKKKKTRNVDIILGLPRIALRYGLDDRGFRVGFPARARNFSLLHRDQKALRPTQPIQLIPGALSLGLKRLGRGANHSLPSRVEVKNTWSYTFTTPIRLHGVVLS